jgi:hypothetical protein
MKPSTAIALRANVVLFSTSTGIASAPFLLSAILFGLPEGGTPALPYQICIFAGALFTTGFLRWRARLAFDAAYRAGLVEVNEHTEFRALISPDCPQAWLVQLHVELRGGALNTSAYVSDH